MFHEGEGHHLKKRDGDDEETIYGVSRYYAGEIIICRRDLLNQNSSVIYVGIPYLTFNLSVNLTLFLETSRFAC